MNAVSSAEWDELRVWLRGRPEAIQNLATEFPPGCLVKATVPLGIPAPGCLGQIVSYVEQDDGVALRVRGRWNRLGPFMDAIVRADELVLAEEGLVTCEDVRRLLEDPS